MFKNVVTALAESRDITLYLSPLMKHFLQFEETDFSESKPLLKPLMHVVSLVSVDNFQRLIVNGLMLFIASHKSIDIEVSKDSNF